ncbi:MAG: hypothetical protein PHV11_03835 [Candidatus Bipolaricaulis sp.]|nr:hypothetical protein [Candidatus Bipolaricaulis sp.]
MAYNTGSDPTLAELITAKFVPEVFSKDVLMHTKSNLVCANVFNTDFRDNLRMGYKVSIPVFSEISTTEVTPGTEPTAADAANATSASVTVDNWYQAAVEISELAAIENAADYLAGGAEAAAYAIAKRIDTTIGVLFSTLGGSSVYGADGQTFSDDIFLALVEYLDENDVPDDGKRALIGDASTRVDLLKIDKFISVDYLKTPVVPTGQIGQIYNCKVYITNNLTDAGTGNYGVLAHRDAIGVVIQKEPRVRKWDMGYKFIQKIIVDAAWGADEIRDTFGRCFYTRSD